MKSDSMADNNAFGVEIVSVEEDSTLNNMEKSSGKTCNTQLLETSIEDSRNKKKTLVSTMDSVKKLTKEVEYEEKSAKEAKEEASFLCSDIIAKVDESKQTVINAEETTNKLAKKVNAVKDVLATKIEAFQLRVAQMLDDGDNLFQFLKRCIKPWR